MPEANSQSVNNTEALRAWLRTCPLLSPNNRFRIDFLSDRATEYALYSVPSTIRYRENVLGERVKQDVQTDDYIFAALEDYGDDTQQNLLNLGFWDGVRDWIDAQNPLHNFPQRNDGTIQYIVPTLSQYVTYAGDDTARYQIQIQVTYKIT